MSRPVSELSLCREISLYDTCPLVFPDSIPHVFSRDLQEVSPGQIWHLLNLRKSLDFWFQWKEKYNLSTNAAHFSFLFWSRKSHKIHSFFFQFSSFFHNPMSLQLSFCHHHLKNSKSGKQQSKCPVYFPSIGNLFFILFYSFLKTLFVRCFVIILNSLQ